MTHHSQEIKDHFEELENQTVTIAGRMMSKRVMGKASFCHVQDLEGSIQSYVARDSLGEEAYKDFKKLDVGDVIGIRGEVFRTKTGEISIHASEVTLLSKSLQILPEKFHGLTNTDLRYRQRYVDLIMNPEVKDTFIKRSKILSAIRTYLAGEGFMEVETPMLVSNAGGAAARPFETHLKDTFIKRSKILSAIRTYLAGEGFMEVETPMLVSNAGGAAARPFETHFNALDEDLKLRISLELYLKRLIVGGLEKVYEIGRVFRNEGLDTRHNPEFTLMELYQAYTDYHGMMDLTENLYRYVAQTVLGTTKIVYNGIEMDLGKPFERITMLDAVKKYSGVDFNEIHTLEEARAAADEHHVAYEERHKKGEPFERITMLDAVKKYSGVDFNEIHTLEEARAAADEHHVAYEERHKKGDILNLFFEEFVEDHLIQPTFVMDHPVEISPLTKKKPDNPDYVERFEFFMNGWEMANAYSDLLWIIRLRFLLLPRRNRTTRIM